MLVQTVSISSDNKMIAHEKASSVLTVPRAEPRSSRTMALLPTAWVPYAQLMRIDRPAGLYAFYVPYLTGLAYGASISEVTPLPSTIVLHATYLLLVCVILRGSTCAFNDNIDQDFDRAVDRCKGRPIARGAVTTLQGHVFTLVLAALGYILLHIWPSDCLRDMAWIFVLFLIYPFGKRFTHYPQLILGFPFAGGIIFACHAVEVDPFSGYCLSATFCLCAANILWTMIYDTIYAHQDLKDDIRAGIKSMAVRFQHSTKLIASILGLVQVGLLIKAGHDLGMSVGYYVLTCGGTAVSLIYMIFVVNLDEPASCAWFFRMNFCLVGGSMVGGFLMEYINKYWRV